MSPSIQRPFSRGGAAGVAAGGEPPGPPCARGHGGVGGPQPKCCTKAWAAVALGPAAPARRAAPRPAPGGPLDPAWQPMWAPVSAAALASEGTGARLGRRRRGGTHGTACVLEARALCRRPCVWVLLHRVYRMALPFLSCFLEAIELRGFFKKIKENETSPECGVRSFQEVEAAPCPQEGTAPQVVTIWMEPGRGGPLLGDGQWEQRRAGWSCGDRQGTRLPAREESGESQAGIWVTGVASAVHTHGVNPTTRLPLPGQPRPRVPGGAERAHSRGRRKRVAAVSAAGQAERSAWPCTECPPQSCGHLTPARGPWGRGVPRAQCLRRTPALESPT